ncbi:hypothetical protein BH24ACT26_BH24ACT26_05180 [soil metagenome]
MIAATRAAGRSLSGTGRVPTQTGFRLFRSTIVPVEILPSSRRQGIADEDIQHGIANAMVVEEVAEHPVRYLVLGPDRAGNLLELAVLDRPQGPAVLHAMTMRPKYGAAQVPASPTEEQVTCHERTGS